MVWLSWARNIMIAVKITVVRNSAGVVLPKELLAKMRRKRLSVSRDLNSERN